MYGQLAYKTQITWESYQLTLVQTGWVWQHQLVWQSCHGTLEQALVQHTEKNNKQIMQYKSCPQENPKVILWNQMSNIVTWFGVDNKSWSMWRHKDIYGQTLLFLHTDAHTHSNTHTHTHEPIHTHAHTHAYTHTHTHEPIHTHTLA